MKKTHRVFVYGTLKHGFYFHNQYLGEGKSEPLGKATASKDYSLYIDGLPHMVAEPTDTAVKGELYLVDETVLKSLDDLEGHPIVYKRELIEVYLISKSGADSGDRLLAWAYLRPTHFKGKNSAFKEDEFL